MSNDSKLLDLFRTMLLIRRFEERLEEMYRNSEIYGSMHLCIGQEATVTGACAAIEKEDYLTCTYRGHGAILSKGTSAKALMAELMGRQTGCCNGRAGSMLTSNLQVGHLLSTGIVGAGIPVAVGAALSAKLSNNSRVALTFFGDGSTNQGTFHEALNMAGLWKLPCVFFCENNQYAEMSPIGKQAAIERLADRGSSYGIPGVVVDGNDVEAVLDITTQAVSRARAGEGSTLIEGITYRFCGHMVGDAQTYRSKEEVESWRSKDPLLVARRKLTERNVKESVVGQVIRDVETEVEEAITFAKQSPEPEKEDVLNHVNA